MPFNLDEARLRLQRISRALIPDNAAVYTYSVVTKKLRANLLGYNAEHDPFTGTVVDVQDAYSIVQTQPNHFVFVEAIVLRDALVVGSHVSITPYARRRFDGSRVKDPVSEQGKAGSVHTTLGACASRIPVDPPSTDLGKHWVDSLERLRCPDGVRVLSNFLVDLGASNFALLEPDTPDPAQSSDLQLVFDCSSSSFNGRVTIGMESECELFYILMHRVLPDGPEQIVHKCEAITFDSVAEMLTTLLCDGQWCFAQVELHETVSEGVAA